MSTYKNAEGRFFLLYNALEALALNISKKFYVFYKFWNSVVSFLLETVHAQDTHYNARKVKASSLTMFVIIKLQ